MKRRLTTPHPAADRCRRRGRDQTHTVPALALPPGDGLSCVRSLLLALRQKCPSGERLLVRAAAVLSGRYILAGDHDTGVSLHCRDETCFDGGRPLGYLTGLTPYPDPQVPTVADIAALADIAVNHDAAAHQAAAVSAEELT